MLSLLYCSVVFKEYEDPAMKDILYVTKGMCFVTCVNPIPREVDLRVKISKIVKIYKGKSTADFFSRPPKINRGT